MKGKTIIDERAETISKAPTPLSFKYLDKIYLSKWLTILHSKGAIKAIRNQFDINYSEISSSTPSSTISKFLSIKDLLYVKKMETKIIKIKIPIKIFDFLSIF